MVVLRRRGAELSYLCSESGREVDALALLSDGQKRLVQVCPSLHDADTSEREMSSLLELADTPAGRFAEPVLISLDARPPDLGDAPLAGCAGDPPFTGYWMTRPDHDLSLLKGDTSRGRRISAQELNLQVQRQLSPGSIAGHHREAQPQPQAQASPVPQRQALSPSSGKLVVMNTPAQATTGAKG